AESPGAEDLLLTQRIAQSVEKVYRDEPGRAAAFAAKLNFYDRWMERFRISDKDLARFSEQRKFAGKSFGWVLFAIVLAPVALYGWLHRLIPFAVVRWSVGRFSESGKRKAQTATVSISAGLVAFG